jgi:hypothetical protein
MTMTLDQTSPRSASNQWLARYYLTRAAFSAAWVASALTLAAHNPVLGAVWLLIYPLWDAAANAVDATRNGGLGQNRTQALNAVISLATALAVLIALQMSLQTVLLVFGAWAILSGLLQLATAIGRSRTSGAQWAMVLSGAQSALAGAFFILQAQQDVPAVIPTIAGYAGFGAFYFLISALFLIIGERLRRHPQR